MRPLLTLSLSKGESKEDRMAYISPALNMMVAAARRSIGQQKCEAVLRSAVRPRKN